MNLDNGNIVEDYEMGEFKACVAVNEDMQLTEVVFEDVAYYSEPVFPGVYHYFDKYLAMDDKRIVGVCLWSTEPMTQTKAGTEDADNALKNVGLLAAVIYSLLITLLFIDTLSRVDWSK